MGDAKRSTGLVIGAILAGNAGILAACGGGGSAAPPAPTNQPTVSPLPSPTTTANGAESTATVNVGPAPMTTTLPAVGGVAPTITIPGISNAPSGSTATITFSEVTQPYPAKARRIIRRDGSTPSYAGWDIEMFFYFDPEFDASVSATFNLGTSNPWGNYWYLDEFTNGLPNCNGLIGPGNLTNDNVSFAGLTNPTPPPAIQEPNGQYVIKFTVIGAQNPISEDPFCATPTPSPSTSPTPAATGTPDAFSSISIQPSMATINPGSSEGFTIYQELNGTAYDGPFVVSTTSLCQLYVSIAVSANHFTVVSSAAHAPSANTDCPVEVTGGAAQIDYVDIDIP